MAKSRGHLHAKIKTVVKHKTKIEFVSKSKTNKLQNVLSEMMK